MGLSTEMRKYLEIFIRATPDPRYDPAIWHEMSIVKRVGRGMAVREPRPVMNERQIADLMGYLGALPVINAGSGFLSRGDMRNALISSFNEWPPKPPADGKG